MVSSHSTAISWVRNRTMDKNSVSTNVLFSFFFLRQWHWFYGSKPEFSGFTILVLEVPRFLTHWGRSRRCALRPTAAKRPTTLLLKAAAPACAFRTPAVKQQTTHICAISWDVSYSKQETTVNSPRQDLYNHTGQALSCGEKTSAHAQKVTVHTFSILKAASGRPATILLRPTAHIHTHAHT